VGEPDIIKANPLNFAADFVAEHSLPGTSLAPTDPVISSIRPQAPTVSKSAQA
jgi:hypothetical protein